MFRLRSLNWKYAIGEVALIFIGISLSLAFDEWRTNRANRKVELDLLYDLRESVQQDSNEVNYQIRICKNLIKTTDYLIDRLPKSETLTDSLAHCLAWLNTYVTLQADYSAYQNISALGFILIDDHALRRQIVDYYLEADRLKAWCEGRINRADLNINTVETFLEFNREDRAIPLDFKKLKSDRRFMFILKKSNELQKVTLEGLEIFRDQFTMVLLKRLPTKK